MKYMLVMEYADSGTLRKYLEKNIGNLTWNDKFKMAHQLACAISCLHDEKIIHRDLVILIFILYSIYYMYFVFVIFFIYYYIIALEQRVSPSK
jgi:serine/threonine protein kinase